jgi:hypothetical protein
MEINIYNIIKRNREEKRDIENWKKDDSIKTWHSILFYHFIFFCGGVLYLGDL